MIKSFIQPAPGHSVQLPLYIIFNIEALFKLETIYFCNPTIYTGLQKINVFLNLTIAEFPKHKSIRFFDKMVIAVYRHSKIRNENPSIPLRRKIKFS